MLGLDVGTTYSSAAVATGGSVEAVSLGTYEVAVPTVVFVSDEGMSFGGEAARRGAVNPDGMAREFKRRVGDPVPLILSNSPYHADRLTALFAKWVHDAVAEQRGELPGYVVVSHPANWTEFQLGLLRHALDDVGLGAAGVISEPEAAALDYAAASSVQIGSHVLVYDLGGGTFDLALLRRTEGGFEHVIPPTGIERLGGIDFDEAVFRYVLRQLPTDVVAAAPETPEGTAALQRLRRVCVDAKEMLSAASSTDVPVALPGHSALVRLTRGEFEQMIRPMLEQTIQLVDRMLSQAGLAAASLDAVLLVGGSSRIPLVPALVTEVLRLPVRVDAHPKLVVAKGAARQADVLGTVDAAGSAKDRPAPRPAMARRRRPTLVIGAVMIGLVVVASIALLTRRGETGEENAASTSVGPETSSPTSESPTSAPAGTTSTPTAAEVTSDRLVAPGSLMGGERLVSVEDAHVLEMTPLGVLQASSDGRVWWQVPSEPVPGALALMQFDGNFVIYPDAQRMGGGDALWNAGTAARGAHLEVIGDGGVGAVVIVGPDGDVLWRFADGDAVGPSPPATPLSTSSPTTG